MFIDLKKNYQMEKISYSLFKRLYLSKFGCLWVPQDHYFFRDNRDCSKDSRFLSSVGYVHKDNLVGKAQFIFSSDRKVGSIFTFENGINQLDLTELLIVLINEN